MLVKKDKAAAPVLGDATERKKNRLQCTWENDENETRKLKKKNNGLKEKLRTKPFTAHLKLLHVVFKILLRGLSCIVFIVSCDGSVFSE